MPADPANRERGLRAALNNPRVSEEARQRDREILNAEYGGRTSTETGSSKMSKSKSTGSAPSSSSSSSGLRSGAGMRTKAPPSRSAIMLPDEESEERSSEMAGGKDTSNIIRGLKAAISNPNVSEKAKERDHQRLRELGGE
ncbi:hypothetical protein QBC37DRAFT_378647 [Rhypophila decipiens]|uniref:Conidiation-specific protein 6 n=1 Tax=Rhypophila decipiens TaxID=261697 RepID=A0AAN7B3G7_9PEZI|nr:hypothetical protein QBC37DRAFT_378647 [Rhypophila decipiens]